MVIDAVRMLVDGLELDAFGKANAEIALTLAGKLDAVREQGTGSAAMAAPALAKELRAVLATLMAGAAGVDEFVAGLFGGSE